MSINRQLLVLLAVTAGSSILLFGCQSSGQKTYVQSHTCTTVRFPEEANNSPAQTNSPVQTNIPFPTQSNLTQLAPTNTLVQTTNIVQRAQVSNNQYSGNGNMESQPSLLSSSVPRVSSTGANAFPSITQSIVVSPAASKVSSVSSQSTVSPTVAGGGTSLPPAQSEVPKVARNAMNQVQPDAVDRSREAGYLVPQKVGDQTVNVPSRERQSIVDKEAVEGELKNRYDQWVRTQKKNRKGDSKIPEYLRPLSDDQAVFQDPNSPFAQEEQRENDKRFVRQITAADLSLMSTVSSRSELMEWEKEESSPIDWSKYSAKTLWNKWRDWAGMGPNEKEALALMKQACEEQTLYDETKEVKHLTKAAELYEKAGRRWTDSVLEEDALFYAGECCFFANNYATAMRHYKQLVSKYSNSILKKAAIERLYYIGCYWVQCSETESQSIHITDSKKPKLNTTFSGAKKSFEAIFMNDTSDTGRAPDALFALANAYMRRGVEQGDASFESAAQYYRQLYEFYPGSKQAEKAYQLTIIALHQSYRGPLYDTRPLKQAEEIAAAAKRLGKGDIQAINEELGKIKEEQARHLWVRGQYYEKRGQYASARSYYNQLVKEFPNCEFTEQAIARYLNIKEQPAEADQYSWVRPVMPFLPKNTSEYFEERPDKLIQVTESKQLNPGNDKTSDALQFSELDKNQRKY